jgi:hypothetical protein
MSHLSRAQDYHREQGSDNRMWSCHPVLIGVAALGIVVWHQARKGWKQCSGDWVRAMQAGIGSACKRSVGQWSRGSACKQRRNRSSQVPEFMQQLGNKMYTSGHGRGM